MNKNFQYTLLESLKSGGKQTLISKNSDWIALASHQKLNLEKFVEINSFVHLPKIEMLNFPIRCIGF